MEYRRSKTPNATYFFTVVTDKRRKILCEPENIDLLRKAFRYGMQNHHFKIDAIAILPDHLHCIWTLPENDADFSTRWRLIKSYFSRYCNLDYQGKVSDSRQKKAEKAVWQRRFWEHQIRDDDDFINHLNYIHYNPVRHGLTMAPKDWPFSSFSRYVEKGFYDELWGASERIIFDEKVGME
jgi:putative transposase